MYDSHKLRTSENPASSFPHRSASTPSQNFHSFTSQPSLSAAKHSSLNHCPKVGRSSAKCYRQTL